ncbi:OsmC/Ohr family protein [Kipferlia bialata]|uniref:OsmC/Ohr family protein n=1 Tax=Kipferlia bialata TaxID=797122 RepID=A0A391NKG9_9EUKA|nr:OsmC/Ohr family protein [Kipferlia bialata]|eukprot:g3088.t1
MSVLNITVSGAGCGLMSAVDCGEHKVHVDYPVSQGGSGKGPNPMETVLSALVGCEQMTAMRVCQMMKIPVANIEWSATMKLNMETAMGGCPAGQSCEAVHVTAKVTGEGVTQEQVETLAEKTHGMCPVASLFRHLPDCEFTHEWTLA